MSSVEQEHMAGISPLSAMYCARPENRIDQEVPLAISFDGQSYAWLSRSTGIPLRYLDRVQMPGSTSSLIFLIQDSRDPSSSRFVLRVLNNQEWLAEEPDLAEHEAAALEAAQLAGLPAPKLVAYSSNDTGFGAPVVLMSFLEGAIELRPANLQAWLGALARQLAAIHQHAADGLAWRYSSWVDKASLAPPPWTAVPPVWERAIELVRGAAPGYRPVFIHRDYHPANILWQNGAVSGVVDWINACRGPAGVDVAHCRTNLTMMHGLAVADQFLAIYSEIDGTFDYQPYWDVDSILDVCLPEPCFYAPWQMFGLSTIESHVLRQRVDAHLERVMSSL